MTMTMFPTHFIIVLMTTTTMLGTVAADGMFSDVVSMTQDYIQEDYNLVKSDQSK